MANFVHHSGVRKNIEGSQRLTCCLLRGLAQYVLMTAIALIARRNPAKNCYAILTAIAAIAYKFLQVYVSVELIAELWRAKRACGAPWVSKSTHPRKFGNHVTVRRPLPVRPHHRETNVQSHTF